MTFQFLDNSPFSMYTATFQLTPSSQKLQEGFGETGRHRLEARESEHLGPATQSCPPRESSLREQPCPPRLTGKAPSLSKELPS